MDTKANDFCTEVDKHYPHFETPNPDHRFSQLRDDRFVKITVGGGQGLPTGIYEVSQQTLSGVSQYFANAFKPHTKEGKAGRIDFPDDESKSWDIFLNWLFKRSLPPVSYNDPNVEYAEVIDQLTHCWIMGDKYDVPTFQNDVMRVLLRHVDTHRPDLETMRLGIEGTVKGSAMRRLVVEEAVMGVYQYKTEYLDDFDDIVAEGYLKDFVDTHAIWHLNSGTFDRVDACRFADCYTHWSGYMVDVSRSASPSKARDDRDGRENCTGSNLASQMSA